MRYKEDGIWLGMRYKEGIGLGMRYKEGIYINTFTLVIIITVNEHISTGTI